MNIKKSILDVIFPIRCISCSRYDKWVCKKCLDKVILQKEQLCPICKKIPNLNGEVCFSCKEARGIDAILVASFYRQAKKKTLLAELIHYYKYRFAVAIGRSLGRILKKSILSSSLPLPDIIIPIPLHPRRLRWRGFNQSLIMAQYLGENLTPGFVIPVSDNLLLRNRYTKPQMEIKNRRQRKINVNNAFSIDTKGLKKLPLKNKIVLLVDDVATTGSTLIECAKVLKKSGAKKVFAVVLARQ